MRCWKWIIIKGLCRQFLVALRVGRTTYSTEKVQSNHLIDQKRLYWKNAYASVE